MNVAPPSLGDRELESLRRAQEAHEPSMDEILASIRNIIEDDREPGAAPVRAPRAVAAEGPQIVYDNDSIASARTIVRTPNAASFASVTPGESIRPTPRVVWQAARPRTASPLAPAPGLDAGGVDEEPLVSAATDAALECAFNALSTSIAMHESGRIESLTRELLRAMLKTWLDDNLPGLVERLVRAEIQRIARGDR